MPYVAVEIPVDDEWPSADDMHLRNAVIDDLDAGSLGQFVGAGGGMGAMDFSYDVEDESVARAAIEAALAKHLPGRAYTINVRA